EARLWNDIFVAAQIPSKNDPVANEVALEKVRADKERTRATPPQRGVDLGDLTAPPVMAVFLSTARELAALTTLTPCNVSSLFLHVLSG
ncbi:MAG: hypothetical protein HYY79_03035, partial [Betaproteobacteria bacterium]|nr:hypothetical protein [Betaproteobacteria bacterium]